MVASLSWRVDATTYANMAFILVENTVAQMDLDNHSDTSCFGSNFSPICLAGQVCNVLPFTSNYKPKKNINNSGTCTAFDNPDRGCTMILEYHQGLWFGLKLAHLSSIKNPNNWCVLVFPYVTIYLILIMIVLSSMVLWWIVRISRCKWWGQAPT